MGTIWLGEDGFLSSKKVVGNVDADVTVWNEEEGFFSLVER